MWKVLLKSFSLAQSMSIAPKIQLEKSLDCGVYNTALQSWEFTRVTGPSKFPQEEQCGKPGNFGISISDIKLLFRTPEKSDCRTRKKLVY